MDTYDVDDTRWCALRDALIAAIKREAERLSDDLSPAVLEQDAIRLESLAQEIRFRAEQASRRQVEQASKVAAEREEVLQRMDVVGGGGSPCSRTEGGVQAPHERCEYAWEIEDAKRAIRLLEEAGDASTCVDASGGRDLGHGPLPGERAWWHDWTDGTNGRWLRVLREALGARERGES